MVGRLLALFICIPLIELALLIQVDKWIGLGPTVLLVVVTGALGAYLARQQGLKVWVRIQTELQAGRVPAGELVDGLLVLLGGILLLTPGLLTDLGGFALLIPGMRGLVKQHLQTRFGRVAAQHQAEPQAEVIDV